MSEKWNRETCFESKENMNNEQRTMNHELFNFL